MIVRCVNIDWLECFCLEDAIGYPHDANYFRNKGWEVSEREYGTPTYREMFTLRDHYGEPFIEIRRAPKSDTGKLHGLFSPYCCHIRLCNRACYFDHAAKSMAQFIAENGFSFQRISRIDICLDFEVFDSGDYPQRFIQRYMSGKYSKINQANIAAHGLDQWDGRNWNSLSWGSNKSMVRTRFYNKVMELRQSHDKPYIRQAWQACGLVDDMHTLEKKALDGTIYKPDIWRLEFAIKSGTKGWFVVEDNNTAKKNVRSLRNTLDVYDSREKIFLVHQSLVKHYFHFKYLEYKDDAKTELQRKDRCRDKVLFNIDGNSAFYSLEKVASARNKQLANLFDRLLKLIYQYRDHVFDNDIRTHCNALIAALERQTHLDCISVPFDESQIEVLRLLLSERLRRNDVPYEQSKQFVEKIVKLEKQIWLEEELN